MEKNNVTQRHVGTITAKFFDGPDGMSVDLKGFPDKLENAFNCVTMIMKAVIKYFIEKAESGGGQEKEAPVGEKRIIVVPGDVIPIDRFRGKR